MIEVSAYRRGKFVAYMPCYTEADAGKATQILVKALGIDILTEWHRTGADWRRWFGTLTQVDN